MGRPLQGTRKRVADGHFRELPTVRGEKARTRYTFHDEAKAEAWLAAGIAALQAGQPLPVPPAADVVGQRLRPSAGTSFRSMATAWKAEYFEELRRAGVSRETTVEAHIEAIASWMEEHGLVVETMVRDQVKAMEMSFARRSEQSTVEVPDGLDPDALVTMDEALRLPNVPSRATLKRRKQDGVLQSHTRDDGRMAYRIGDLYTHEVGGGTPGGLRRGPKREHGYAQEVLQDFRRVFEAVCQYASDYGVGVPDDRTSLKLPITDRPDSPKRQPVSLADCVAVAGRLHAVHQVALWLMRILGLRISEAYGIRIRNLVDYGPGKAGVVFVRAQGGRKFKARDRVTGKIISQHHVDAVKADNSYRALVVPPALMDLLRLTVTIFHTDNSGAVRPNARLIPGLARTDESGQSSFRRALKRAATAVGVRVTEDDEEEVFSCTPHDMRRSIISELTWKKVDAAHRKRFAGHAAGDDVHHRHYVLDDLLLRPAREIAELTQRTIDDEVPGGLAIPTLLRCTTGSQEALAKDAGRIDAELLACCWQVLPDADGDPLLAPVDVARVLGVTPQVARRWMASGRVSSVHWADRARGEERRARLSDVLRIREEQQSQVTLVGLAEEVGQPYHTVYQYVRAQGLTLDRNGQRDYTVPAETAEHLRAHYRRQAELHARAVPLSVAANMLNTTAAVIMRLIEDGSLVEDERAHDGRRMVTRDSVKKEKEQRTQPRRRVRNSAAALRELYSWDEAQAVTGLSDAELTSLTASGILDRRQHNRRRHLTRTSVLRYLVDNDPTRLQIVAVVG